MKLLYFIFFCLIHVSIYSFTLDYENGAKFQVRNIKIDISSTSCTNTLYEPIEILNKTMIASDRFWNKVSTSDIKLTKGSLIDIDTNRSGESEIDAFKNIFNLMSSGTILIGCSSNPSFFSPGVGAVSSIDSIRQNKAIILLNNKDTTLSFLSESQLITLLGHELGHALGLGHSQSKSALMFANVVVDDKVQEMLSYDDIDGLNFLYPNFEPSASCSSVKFTSSNSSGESISRVTPFVISLLFGFLLSFFTFLIYRTFRTYVE